MKPDPLQNKNEYRSTDKGSASKGMQKPWLVAVTGKRGSGKTRLLAGLMDYLRREGRSFDGVLSIACGRTIPDAGAQRYILKWPLQNREILLCERTGSGIPPYYFHADAWKEVVAWINDLQQSDEKPEIIILDELGRLEANGDGFAVYWQRILETGPVIIIASIREGSKAGLEKQLGQSFDLVIEAIEESALEKLCRLSSSANDWQRTGRYGAAAGAIEVSLGTILNATKIPFRGVPMSIIQAIVLFFAGSKLARPWLVVWVSYIAAALKALSPAGNRLRPMTAIAVQGSLFGLSVKVLGWNMAGITIGAWCVGAWAGLQGLVFQYLLLGNALFDAYGELQLWFTQQLGITIVSLPVLITIYVFFTGMLSAVVISYFQWSKRPPALLKKALTKPAKSVEFNKQEEIGYAKKLWFEYRQKAFWVPLVIVFAILLFSGSSTAELASLPLRAAGILAAIFVIISVLKPGSWVLTLRKHGFWGAAITLERILGKDKPLNRK
jgi:nucleoside-triphosphatase THEP1